MTSFNRHNPVLGTPLSATAVKVMLLGSGELGKEVVISLQRLGVEVIAVDRYANAPAQQVAHRAHVIDMTNPAALKALIEQEQPDLVVPEIEAIATQALVELEQAGKVTVVPTARAAYLTMNREGIRTVAAEQLKLPTSAYRFANTREELHEAAQAVGFPCFVKPIMSSSGKGQSKVDHIAEIDAAWDYAAKGGRVDMQRVIVEGMIDFDYEITQLTVRALNAEGQIQTYFCEPIGHVQVKGDYVESWQPQPMSNQALASTRQIADAITTELGGLGIFGVELFVKGDQVWFSEVSPRPHDTGLVTLASQTQSEFELHAKAILGLPVDTSLKSPAASAVIYGGLDAQALSYQGVRHALAIPGTDIRLFGKPESFVRRRMGVALATASHTDEARVKAKAAAAAVKPID